MSIKMAPKGLRLKDELISRVNDVHDYSYVQYAGVYYIIHTNYVILLACISAEIEMGH